MTRGRIALIVTAVVVAAAFAVYGSAFKPVTLPPPTAHLQPPTDSAAFVGAETCASCHAAQFASWQRSTHGRAGGPPSPDLVLAPFGGAVIRFANAVVAPEQRGGAYAFIVARPGEPAETLAVGGVIGGGHIYGGGTQGFVALHPDGTWRLIPFEWSRHNRAWFCNTNSRSGRGWTPITPAMRIEECGDWPPTRVLGDLPRYANCQSCHASQATVSLDSAAARYATRFTSLAINCESCHGPARAHVELARAGQLRQGADIGLVALATLDKDASVRACYSCHSVKDQLREGYRSGDALESYYSLKFPLLGDSPLHEDGRIRTFAYQEGHSFSDCYINGGMTCVSCHDPHDQSYRTVTAVPIAGRFNDAQCTSCHLSKADTPRDHTQHPPSVACTSCHMPSRQEPDTRAARRVASQVVKYERADHTVAIPRPARDSALGMVSACATCHATLTTAQQVERIRAWWGQTKPDVAGPSAYKAFVAIARTLERVTPDLALDPSLRPSLEAWIDAADLDVRAAALATLHLAEGNDRSTRRQLVDAIRRERAANAELRDRWSVALGYMGDRYAGQGQHGSAVIAFSRAVEVAPSSARLHLNLANARRESGDLAGALASYRRSLDLDARAPIAWVNYGIALGQSGDTAAAIRALERAAALDPNEPLASFNLGNLHFVRGDLVRAAAMYERTARADPSIALAHFQLARVSLLGRDEGAALRHLRHGLAFDSSDASAREMARVLAARVVNRP